MDYKKEAKKEIKEDRDEKIIDEIKYRLLQIEVNNKKIDGIKVEIKEIEKQIDLLAEGKLDIVYVEGPFCSSTNTWSGNVVSGNNGILTVNN